ncbi:hypothetical protein CDV36_016252 [Fusarium kuroshium]|uniref:Uncharacterized protein n=1 Tax=Fusarium kuroshium TaxID=2010991 RepID=A0A3M2QWD1_9HYPO|nr:hypothetical protein CDV36_016252 [Fusarium kuroshium]
MQLAPAPSHPVPSRASAHSLHIKPPSSLGYRPRALPVLLLAQRHRIGYFLPKVCHSYECNQRGKKVKETHLPCSVSHVAWLYLDYCLRSMLTFFQEEEKNEEGKRNEFSVPTSVEAGGAPLLYSAC